MSEWGHGPVSAPLFFFIGFSRFLNAFSSYLSAFDTLLLSRSPTNIMDLKHLRELLQMVGESGVAEVEIEEKDFKLVIRKNAPTISVQHAAPMPTMYPPMMPYAPPLPAPLPVQAATPPAPAPQPTPKTEAPMASASLSGHVVKAPIVGTFYSASSPETPPYVKVGDSVSEGQTLCIIEAMKLMNEIEAEVSGTVLQILVENGKPVEYDQALFVIG